VTVVNIDRAARAQGLLEAANAAKVPAAALGGVAFQLLCPSARPGGRYHRAPADIDLATTTRGRRSLDVLAIEAGFVPDDNFNRMNGSTRLRYEDADGSHLDVFVDEFRLCHLLTWGKRLAPGQLTLPLAELLLTKLQVVRLEAKDRSDLQALLTDRWVEIVAERSRLTELVRNDWGLWRTARGTLEALAGSGDDVPAGRAGELLVHWQGIPFGPRARMRAAVGDRVRWYEEPEEM
jgi:hypothetical protein